MRFAYRDVGEGREQDAEASYLSTSYAIIETLRFILARQQEYQKRGRIRIFD
jgi:hypothetical protein